MATHIANQRTDHGSSDRPQRCETLIIGGGQAGLAVAYHLALRGRRATILERNERIGDGWRRHWDSLRLYSPARYDALPGMPFPADDWEFPTKDEVADYLEAYAHRFATEVHTGVHVDLLTRRGDTYVALAGDRRFEADDVVVATGTFGPPYRPGFATDLDPEIVQLHSSGYRGPDQLPPGPVLIVGASHSGADIAVEVAADHPTVLAGRSTGQIPVPLESGAMRALFPVLWFMWGNVANIRTPVGRRMRAKVRTHGGPLLRYRDPDLEKAGVERVHERVVGVEEGMPVLDGGRRLEVTNVIWCTGFHPDLSWIDLPITGDDGWPIEHRGVVPSAPGLYFTGLAFQSSFRSMLIGGAGDDAERVVRHLVRHRAGARTLTPAGAALTADER